MVKLDELAIVDPGLDRGHDGPAGFIEIDTLLFTTLGCGSDGNGPDILAFDNQIGVGIQAGE